MLPFQKNRLHEALEYGLYEEASELIRSSGEDCLIECYENHAGYSPRSFKSCLHIIAGLADEQQAVRLCQEFLSQVTQVENRDKLLNATVVEVFGRVRARVAAIHIAAYMGNTGVVRLLCKKYNVDANCRTSQRLNPRPVTGITPLYWAAAGGHIEVVELLIGDVNASCNDYSRTALHVACLRGHSELVKWLLARQADVSAREQTGATPLYVSAERGHADVVKLLLDKEADVNARRTDIGTTPLYIAAHNGHAGIVKLLLDNEADVNARRTDIGATPLYIAAQNGHVDIVKLLLDNEADVKLSLTDTGATPLYVAAQNGHVDIVKLLLDNEADVNAIRTDIGATPLYIAAQSGHVDIVKLLLDNEADVKLSRTDTGATPLIVADRNGHEDIVKLLLLVKELSYRRGIVPYVFSVELLPFVTQLYSKHV